MRTMITAHSGAENTRDNTLESIRFLTGIGTDALEIDVSTLNGALVLSHDRPAEDEIPAKLSECFRIIAAQAGLLVNVDVKEAGIAQRIIAEAEKCGVLDRILFTGDVLTDADRRAIADAGVPLWYNHTQVKPGVDLLQGASDAGYEVLNVNYRLITGDMLWEGGRLSAWTVNDEEALRTLLQAGARNITTRIPLTAMRLRDEIQG